MTPIPIRLDSEQFGSVIRSATAKLEEMMAVRSQVVETIATLEAAKGNMDGAAYQKYLELAQGYNITLNNWIQALQSLIKQHGTGAQALQQGDADATELFKV